jgi:hypothetical protein
MLSVPQQRVMRTFRRFLIGPGQMLCFYGPQLKQHRQALDQLADMNFVIKEQFKGGYSLTKAGFSAMKKTSA